MEKVLVFILAAFFILGGQGVYAASQQELAELQRKAKEKEQQLKQYKEQENRLSRELRTLTQKERQAQRLSVKLSGDIEVIKTQRRQNLEHKDLMEENVPMWQGIVQEELSNYIIEEILLSDFYDSDEITQQLIMASLIKTHIIFLQKIDAEVETTKEKIEVFEEKNKELLAKKTQVETQKENLKDNYAQKKQALDTTHQQYEKAAKDLKDLKSSAQQLQKILKQAEEKRKADAKKAGTTASKAASNAERNSLPWPVSGKIISKFGKEYQAQLKTWIFRDGIKIAARENTPVQSVKDGTVIFAGEFRSYGNVVIIDHQGGFFTIYGFLNEIRVREDQKVHQGQIVGLSGTDTQGAAMGSGQDAVYFEIRVGTSAVDPALWLKAN